MSLIYMHSVSPSSIIFTVTDKDALLVLRAVVSKVGNFAIMICREFKLAHEVPAQEPFFPLNVFREIVYSLCCYGGKTLPQCFHSSDSFAYKHSALKYKHVRYALGY